MLQHVKKCGYHIWEEISYFYFFFFVFSLSQMQLFLILIQTFINRSWSYCMILSCCSDGDVILECHPLPVMEQQTVILRCRKKSTSHNLPADFHIDGNFTETGYKGETTIHNVSKSSEGLYRCSISGPRGESPESRLVVKGDT